MRLSKRLTKSLEGCGCEVWRDFPMSSHTAMRVGGEARMAVFPQTPAAFLVALKILSSESFPFSVLGAGSNTIARDGAVERAVISTRRLKNFEISADAKVTADCGAPLSAIMSLTARAGFSGLEFAAGIPGTVGGAVFMNAGANGGETADVIERVEIWSDGARRALSRDDMNFSYRSGGLPSGSVLLSARLRLVRGDSRASAAVIKKNLIRRKLTQPVGQANTGSIFKNPHSVPAGRLLEEIGMKGFSVGAAQFSAVHANFIVNKGGAKASDVLKLMGIAKEAALKKRGITLQPEVCVI